MSVDVRAKLAEKGLVLPVSSKPLAAYVPAVRTGNIVFTAGQLPMVDGKIAREGKVGSDVTVEEAYELAKICALNALSAVELVTPVDLIVKVVRIVCYVNGAPGFTLSASSCKWSIRALYAYLGRCRNRCAKCTRCCRTST
jgi:enamine deaminase RidA (YjgF/YER057c/UK114 family)